MWNFFSREAFPYEIGEKDEYYTLYSVFTLHSGVKKNSGEKVSIFSYNVKNGNNDCLENARSTIRKLKTLKHPSILSFVDSYEDDNVIHLVTEPVVPVLSYINSIPDSCNINMYLKLGLHTIADAVKFLNDHKQRHNNIFHGTVFVDNSGTWKLGEIGYITNIDSPYPKKVLYNLLKYNTPDSNPCLTADHWGLGILIWEVFNGDMKSSGNLNKPLKIPNELAQHFLTLTKKGSSKPGALSELIEGCSRNNVLFAVLDNLQNYHLKDKDVKAKVCKDLQSLLPSIPKEMILNKVLKLLKQAYDFDSENSVFLVPVVSKIPSLVSEEEFQASVEQFIITLFSSNDRATRLALLMDIETIINKINKKSINELFPYVSTGFLDSNPKIRSETVKALVHFAPRLSKKHLNDEALRLLLQIQAKDTEAFIRNNTTICLGKIAHCLQPDTRKKILLTAFLQALRDPYPAVRNAGVQAIAVTHRFFPLDMLARNILPALVCLTIDVDSNVRQNVFKTIKVLFSKLEKFSESPELKEELEKDVMSQVCENNSSWSGWAFAAITSKFLKPDVRTKSEPEQMEESKPEHVEESKQRNARDMQNLNYSKVMAKEKIEHKNTQDSYDCDCPEVGLVDIGNLKLGSNHTSNIYDNNINIPTEDNDGDNSDWENDGWGEAHEEVLAPPKPVLKPNESATKRKKSTGPLKLGTSLHK